MEGVLTDIQQRAVALKVGGWTNPAIGEELGVDRRTVWKWLKLPHVQAEMRQLRAEAHGDALNVLTEGAAKVARELMDIALDKRVNPAVRAQACAKFLDLTFKGVDSDFRAEIVELKEMLTGSRSEVSEDA